jgi:hypothetical protein
MKGFQEIDLVEMERVEGGLVLEVFAAALVIGWVGYATYKVLKAVAGLGQ